MLSAMGTRSKPGSRRTKATPPSATRPAQRRPADGGSASRNTRGNTMHGTAGLSGLVLCLMDLYTGARWGELVGQQRHEYDRERQAIGIQQPLKEIGGQLFKGAAVSAPAATPMARPPQRHGNGHEERRRTRKEEPMLWFPSLRDSLEPGNGNPVQDRIAISSPFES